MPEIIRIYFTVVFLGSSMLEYELTKIRYFFQERDIHIIILLLVNLRPQQFSKFGFNSIHKLKLFSNNLSCVINISLI